jgi:5-methylcytosine-specific restriction endonuclease McrA
MIPLKAPPPPIHVLYPRCAKRTEDQTLRTALFSEQGRVVQRSAIYADLAASAALYLLEDDDCVHVTGTELSDLYSRVLRDGGERAAYDRIRQAARYGRCALCAQRDAKTLDHYLPRESFPEFAILPINLVPCCYECNNAKGTHSPTGYDDQFFHPYFDNWDDFQILSASVTIGTRILVDFKIDTANLPIEVAERAHTHFDSLNLGSLYSDNAAVELVQRKETFRTIFEVGGPIVFRDELLREANSRRHPFPNAWQPAMYEALAMSNPFVEGEFERIDS